MALNLLPTVPSWATPAASARTLRSDARCAALNVGFEFGEGYGLATPPQLVAFIDGFEQGISLSGEDLSRRAFGAGLYIASGATGSGKSTIGLSLATMALRSTERALNNPQVIADNAALARSYDDSARIGADNTPRTYRGLPFFSIGEPGALTLVDWMDMQTQLSTAMGSVAVDSFDLLENIMSNAFMPLNNVGVKGNGVLQLSTDMPYENRILVIDSLTLLLPIFGKDALIRAGGATAGVPNMSDVTMPGGVERSTFLALSLLESIARRRYVSLIAIVNSNVFPRVRDLEGVSFGYLEVGPDSVSVLDRIERSSQITYRIPQPILNQSRRLIGYKIKP